MQRFLTLIGLELTPPDHKEKVLSMVGGFVAIMLTAVVARHSVGGLAAGMVVASMGASAVLLFAVPHGPLSQPWAFVAGHVLSALAGVTCQKLLGQDPLIAGAAAVGLTIGMMYYARCIHPPGGATALTAVVGGAGVHKMGYGYILAPVAMNCAVMLATAVAFNYPLAWRRYPAALVRRNPMPRSGVLTHEHLSYALGRMGSMIDVSEADLAEIYSLALQHARGTHMAAGQIESGRSYANSPMSPGHAVRRLVEIVPGNRPEEDLVLFWTVSGSHPRRTSVVPREAFALWAQADVTDRAVA